MTDKNSKETNEFFSNAGLKVPMADSFWMREDTLDMFEKGIPSHCDFVVFACNRKYIQNPPPLVGDKKLIEVKIERVLK